jgi:protein O-GlcNAc transferase
MAADLASVVCENERMNCGVLSRAFHDKNQGIAILRDDQHGFSGSSILIDELRLRAFQHLQRGDLTAAAGIYRQILAMWPRDAQSHCNLGLALLSMGRPDEAQESLELALQYSANSPAIEAAAYLNLGLLHQEAGRMDEAESNYRLALARNPNQGMAWNNLGLVCFRTGRIGEALAHLDQAQRLEPQNAMYASNRVFFMHFQAGVEEQALRGALDQWRRAIVDARGIRYMTHTRARYPAKRLKVGYVSPDLREHPVGRFMLPLIAAHDPRVVDVHCYADVAVRDRISGEIAGKCGHWRNTQGMSDEQVADTIRRDEIDILIDLSMHMDRNRLLVFARKPAPVQVTYLAYVSTTGLEAIDYRLTDAYLDPPGTEGGRYTEESVRLPRYWCYAAAPEAPEVGELPALKRGYVTFGCLNNFCKVNDGVLEAWAQVLKGVPGSRLLVHAPEGNHRERVWRMLEGMGVARARCEFAGSMTLTEYYERYQRIDVALDPFPYAGGTTTCDALWMGVPVVTLRGERAVGRGGVSILSSLGVPQWIARTREEYVEIARGLAGEVAWLAEWRRSLREQMRRSPLMDAADFARGFEEALRGMWRAWCME